MTSNGQKINDTKYFTDDLSSNARYLSNSLATIELNDFELTKQTLLEECTLWKKQCNELTLQKQEIEIRSDMLLAENRRLIEEKDNELKHLREVTCNNSSIDLVESIKYQQIINELKDENTHLKNVLELQEQRDKNYDEQIHTLQLRIKELEDWNEDFQENNSLKQDHSDLQSNIDLLTSRNSQLENDLQRLQLQQRNNQLALERLDEYEETISQLQEELDQLRSNKKKQQLLVHDEDTNHLLIEERKRNETISHTLEKTRSQLEEFEQEKTILQEQREIFERQIIELNEEIQSLENINYQLQQQIQITPGSPPTINSLIDTQIIHSLNSLYEQFLTLLPSEFILSDKTTNLSLSDRFTDLFEQFSTYIGTFSIVQEELDSLKQILNEKQDELEKLRTHLELTTDTLTQLQEEQQQQQQISFNKNKSFESDEDELEEILNFQQRAPSQQSLLSVTPGEKQQLIAQNELLSSLLTDKEQELIELQQTEKTHEDLIKNLRLNLQQMEFDKEVKQIELNDIRNVLDEKIRENSSLKKEKIYFIEKITQFERERQEQQTITQISPKQPTPDREKSPPPTIKLQTTEQNITQMITHEQYEQLRSEYNQLLEVSTRQNDESLVYYNEYTRILTLYNELTTKYSQLQIEYETIQSLIQQKMKLIYNKKSDDIDLLNSKINNYEIKLEKLMNNEKQLLNKQFEFELNIKLLEENNLKLISNQQLFEQIQIDLKRITHERDLAIVEKKQLEINQEKLLQFEEREQKLTKEIEINTQQISITESEYSKLEEININLNEQIKYLENNLQHFQQERNYRNNEQLIQYQDSLREQISITARLTNENNEILQRLNDEMMNKDLLINKLQLEIDLKSKQIIEFNENFQTTNNSRIEKQLVKNILLSYFNTPIDKQQEVIPLLSALVGFTQDEYQQAINAITNNTTGTNWLTSWLSTTSSKTKIQSESQVNHPDKSFAELLIQYVDQQSTDNTQEPISNIITNNTSNNSAPFIT